MIDGGSTDGSREFIEQHQDRFAYWCSEKDNGIYHAMNKGIRQAKGEYLNFMNAGDAFACSKTLAGVFSEQRTADILYGYMMHKTVDGFAYFYKHGSEGAACGLFKDVALCKACGNGIVRMAAL